MPNIDGGVTRAPELGTMSVLRNHTASMAYASASVTTPSVRPRGAQRREADHHADDGRDERGQQRSEREGHTPVLGEGAEAERRGAGQGELGQRDLAGVAGHDDEREPDDRGDERADHRGAPRPRRQHERDEADGGADDRGDQERPRPRGAAEWLAG